MATVEPSRWSAAVFDFDGTLAPNLDLPGMRREVRDCTLGAGVPAAVIENHYIVEMIDQAHAWLHQREPQLASNYFLAAHQIILRILHHSISIPICCRQPHLNLVFALLDAPNLLIQVFPIQRHP
jgi:hypothetical protein